MPPRKRPASPNRCTFKEGRRRCIYNGVSARPGSPILCRGHQVAYEYEGSAADVIHRVVNGERVTPQDVIGGVADFFRRAFGGPPPAWDTGAAEQHHRGVGGSPRDHWSPEQKAAWDNLMRGAGPLGGQPRASRQPPPPAPPPPPPRVDPRKAQIAAARKELGFTAKEPLDADKVKKQYRKLARKHHPDRGGSVARMQAINAAAEVLSSADAWA